MNKDALNALIRELVLEHVIAEKFGEKIGDQESLSGVADERNEEIEEVAPPGKEGMVKALKKNPKIDNPWAVAWAAWNDEQQKKK